MRRPVLIALRAVVGAIAVVAVGCTDPLEDDRPATEEVFLETCAPGGAPIEEEVCRCAFDRIVDDLSPAALERLDRNLRDDPGTVPSAVTEAALACAAEPLTNP